MDNGATQTNWRPNAQPSSQSRRHAYSRTPLPRNQGIGRVTGSGARGYYPTPPGHILRSSDLEAELIAEASGANYQTRNALNLSALFAGYRKLSSGVSGKIGSQEPIVMPEPIQEESCPGTSSSGTQTAPLLTEQPSLACAMWRGVQIKPKEQGVVSLCNTTPGDMVVGLLWPMDGSSSKPEESGAQLERLSEMKCVHSTDQQWRKHWSAVAVVRQGRTYEGTIRNTSDSAVSVVFHVVGDVELCADNQPPVDSGVQCCVENCDQSVGTDWVMCDAETQVMPGDFEWDPVGDVCPSIAHRNATWSVKVVDGVKQCTLVTETNLRPSYAGPSARYQISTGGYDENDRRPFKVIEFFSPKGYSVDVSLIDYELFWHLRREVLFKAFDEHMLANLRVLAKRFFNDFKTPHLDIALVCNITEATCLAAAAPPPFSMLLAQSYISRKRARGNKKYRELVVKGQVAPKWWQFWRGTVEMFESTS